MLSLIKSDQQYEQYLNRIEELMEIDPAIDSPESDELEVLSLIVEKYEDEYFPIEKPSPIEAIKFRMDQQGLSAKDMISYFGSRSKVSEVLNGKRSLSLKMIRLLHARLDIPTDILLGENPPSLLENPMNIEWDKFPFNEMIKKGYISYNGSLTEAKEFAEELIKPFIKPIYHLFFQDSFCRQSIRSNREFDPYSLLAWQAQVLHKCTTESLPEFKTEALNNEFCQRFRHLTMEEGAPRKAITFLQSYGIQLIIEPHLPKTYLDGWVHWDRQKNPVIALTLRMDRIDNFWFTLAHELSHLMLHFNQNIVTSFIDEIESKTSTIVEIEADTQAQDLLIPNWDDALLHDANSQKVIAFAHNEQIHPAIVAGRIRREKNNYRILSRNVGYNCVRKHFFSTIA